VKNFPAKSRPRKWLTLLKTSTHISTKQQLEQREPTTTITTIIIIKEMNLNPSSEENLTPREQNVFDNVKHEVEYKKTGTIAPGATFKKGGPCGCDKCGKQMAEPILRERWQYLLGTVYFGFVYICDQCWPTCEKALSVKAPWSQSNWVEPKGKAKPSNAKSKREMQQIVPL